MSSCSVGRPSPLIVVDQHYWTALDPHVSINWLGMSIPTGRKLYLCSTHDLIGRVLILPMGIKVYSYPAHVNTIPWIPVPWVKLPSLFLRIFYEFWSHISPTCRLVSLLHSRVNKNIKNLNPILVNFEASQPSPFPRCRSCLHFYVFLCYKLTCDFLLSPSHWHVGPIYWFVREREEVGSYI
jgi:hypothetical protein